VAGSPAHTNSINARGQDAGHVAQKVDINLHKIFAYAKTFITNAVKGEA